MGEGALAPPTHITRNDGRRLCLPGLACTADHAVASRRYELALAAILVGQDEGGSAAPEVRSNGCAETTRTRVALDVHMDSITAGILSAEGGPPEVVQLENSERALRRFARRLGDPGELAVCYEAGPCGYDLFL